MDFLAGLYLAIAVMVFIFFVAMRPKNKEIILWKALFWAVFWPFYLLLILVAKALS